MRYEIEISFKPAYELLTSLTVFKSPWVLRTDLGENWYAQVRENLSQSFLSKLDKERSIWDPMLLLIWGSNAFSADEFIDWLSDQPVSLLAEMLQPWISKIPKSLPTKIATHLYLLQQWNEQYFKKVDTTILNLLLLRANEDKRFIEEKSYNGIPNLTSGFIFEPNKDLKKVLLIPQYHSIPVPYYCCFDGVTACMYNGMKTGSIKEKQHVLTNPLAQNIVTYLLHESEPKTFTEIQNNLKLSKEELFRITYQMRMSGLLFTHVKTERLFLYSLPNEVVDYYEKSAKI